MLHPKIDRRRKDDLVEKMKEIVPYYTPEWRFNDDDPDLGSALFLIFADMFSKNIDRFNRTPLKHFISFLNLFDVSLKTPHSATAYATFFLSPGTNEEVFVEKGTKLSAHHEEEEIIFETEKHLLLTPAIITDAYKVSANPDAIIRIPERLFPNGEQREESEEESCHMFYVDEGENLQEHCLYISDEQMFNVASTVKIELALTHSLKRYQEEEIARAMADESFVEWSYFSENEWKPFQHVTCTNNKIVLHKTTVAPIEETEIYSLTGRWLRCKLKKLSSEERTKMYGQLELSSIYAHTDYVDLDGEGGFLPDLLFADDLHLPIEELEHFYPFGEQFSLYNTLYISSQEAFSKKGSNVSIHFTMTAEAFELKHSTEEKIEWKLIMKESQFKQVEPQKVSILKVAWEYWNGQTWVMLPIDKEYEEIFHCRSSDKIDVSLTFTCPNDMTETFVHAEKNYWVRVRVLTIDHLFANDLIYYSPKIEKFRLSYESNDYEKLVDECITYNNLEYKNERHVMQTEGLSFRPFSMIHETAPSFYLGFDRPLSNGPLSIYFNLQEATVSEESRPFIEWQYLRKKGNAIEWAPLKVVDGTQAMTKSGECRLSGPHDFVKQSLFSKQRYWIRIVNRNAQLHQQDRSAKLKGVYLNTTKVVQREEIVHENPVVIENGLQKTYQLMNYPVLTEDVWVDERKHISEVEIARLLEKEQERIRIIRDSEQNILRCWVKWERVEHFLHSKATDRHYMIERSEGKLTFGDGKNGKKLANSESDDIVVHYKIGGGTKGNIPRFSLTTLQSALPFVQSVTNYERAGGGSNLEKLREALKRGPLLIKHRNRAVTAQDFEALVREAAHNVAKVKCLSNYNAQLQKEVGSVTIVVLPEGGVESLHFFSELKEKIETYLLSSCANTIAFSGKIEVIKPAFLEVSLNMTLIVEHIEQVVVTENEVLEKLERFLNPFTGNEDGRGWKIGQQIHLSVFYAFLKSIRHVRFVERLYMSVYQIENGERTELDASEVIEVPHGIVVNGKHQVRVRTS